MEENRVNEQINDFVGDNVKKLAQLFPSVVKDGEVDFEALKEELGEFKEVGNEKYELTWAGKQEAKRIAQEDIVGKTLKYIPEESKDADTTENLYIEGDNLEVLKLLRQNYYGAIKMIYIDPPYNTGNDFVYNDSFKMNKEEADLAEGVIDELGERYTQNKSSSNRYHANWMNMMYPRLKIAKDLLSDDGIIFISIDDIEIDHLRMICQEIFGDDNFICEFVVASNSSKNNSNYVSVTHEYILCFAKNKEFTPIEWKTKKTNSDEYIKKAKDLMTKLDESDIHSELLSLVKYPKFYEFDHYTYVDKRGPFRASDLTAPGSKTKYDVIHPITKKPCKTGTRGWAYSYDEMQRLIENDYILFGKDETVMPQLKNYLLENEKSLPKSVLFFDSQSSTKWMKGQGFGFDFPKSIDLIKYMISMYPEKNYTVLDFFSGSATTAHAIMQINADDKGNRKSIMVQLPEKCKNNDIAFDNGYKTICDIGKERIRRAGDKIKTDSNVDNLDIGFKVFKVSNTNIKWNSEIELNKQIDLSSSGYTPELLDFMPGTKDIDIVYELMLRQRDVALSEKLDQLSEIGERTYLYASSFLVCLETEITEELIDKLAALEPLPIKFIFRDSAFKDDIALKDETFRRLKMLVDKNSGMNKSTYTVEFI